MHLQIKKGAESYFQLEIIHENHENPYIALYDEAVFKPISQNRVTANCKLLFLFHRLYSCEIELRIA